MATEKFIPADKLSKKEKQRRNNANRVRASFNTGTQIHKDRRHKTRAQEKQDLRASL